METIIYSSKGLVHGNYWGGGKGAYEAIPLYNYNSKEELMKANADALFDGSLDSGMGFEALRGALIIVKKTTKIIVNGKPFKNEEYEEEFIGELNDEEEKFLEECSMRM